MDALRYQERLDELDLAMERLDNERSYALDPIELELLDAQEKVLKKRRRHLHGELVRAQRRALPFGGALQGHPINPDKYPNNVRTR